MDDFNDFGNGFDNGDFEDSDGEFYSDDDGLNEETQDESKDEDNGIDIGWEEIAMFGSLAEEISIDEQERRRIKRKMNKDKDQNDI